MGEFHLKLQRKFVPGAGLLADLRGVAEMLVCDRVEMLACATLTREA